MAQRILQEKTVEDPALDEVDLDKHAGLYSSLTNLNDADRAAMTRKLLWKLDTR